MSAQGEVVYATNPFMKWLIIGLCVFAVGFGGFMYLRGKAKTTVQADTAAPVATAQKPADSKAAKKSTSKKKKRR